RGGVAAARARRGFYPAGGGGAPAGGGGGPRREQDRDRHRGVSSAGASPPGSGGIRLGGDERVGEGVDAGQVPGQAGAEVMAGGQRVRLVVRDLGLPVVVPYQDLERQGGGGRRRARPPRRAPPPGAGKQPRRL